MPLIVFEQWALLSMFSLDFSSFLINYVSHLCADGSSKIWITIVVVSVIGVAILLLVISMWWRFNTKIKGKLYACLHVHLL